MSDIRLRQGFLDEPGSALFVMVYEQPEPAPAVVIAPAYGVSCSEPRYLLPLLGSRLARDGYSVVLYDHPGSGDSLGRNPRWVGRDDVIRAGTHVVRFAASISTEVVGVVGYGLGATVATELLARGVAPAIGLLAPCLQAWRHGPDWLTLCQPGNDGLVAPEVTPDRSRLGDVWRVVYGEPVVPAQLPGPVGERLLAEVGNASPLPGLKQRPSDVLIVSDLSSDLEVGVYTTVRLRHDATPQEPSWHWSFSCRMLLIDSVAGWVSERARSGADSSTGVASRGSLAVQARAGDGRVHLRRIRVDGDEVFGVLRTPDARRRDRLCVVYETGNPGQRVDVHGCGPLLAERLAAAGISSFRYDPRGMGLSAGRYQDMTWSRRQEDLSHILDVLAGDGFDIFVILGNSSGARVAIRAAHEDDRVAGLVLWGPILRDSGQDGSGSELVRVSGGLATAWCGLPLGLRYQRDARTVDVFQLFAESFVPACVIFADDESDLVNKTAVLDAASLREGITTHTAPGQHGFSWEGLSQAIDHSVRWVENVRIDATSATRPPLTRRKQT